MAFRVHRSPGEPVTPAGIEQVDLVLTAGARPNFVKLAPLHRALNQYSTLRTMILHTGQHYDEPMSEAFFRDLNIPSPHVNLRVGSGTHAKQTAAVMVKFEHFLEKVQPRWVVVFGDVNSTLACALVAAKLELPVAHVEAGLRSNDWSMPEEINRVLTDRLSTRLYAPTREACHNLTQEGIAQEKVQFVGNIMVDTLLDQLPRINQRETLNAFRLQRERFILVTLHRPSNVDSPERLAAICAAFSAASEREPVIFSAHPRTQARLRDLGLTGSVGNTRVIEPLPYKAFLGLMANARVVVTDSGGVQEETTALGVPCLTLRTTTERPITISEGTNQLVEPEPATFLKALNGSDGRRHRIPELWDGKTAVRIAKDLAGILDTQSMTSTRNQ